MKQKTDPTNPHPKEDEKKLSQWKREKALKTSKEFGVSLLQGMANGLSMYGQVAPSLYFGAPLPTVPNYSNNTKKC
ncbi:MAG: hypothetical protein K2X50_02770 [Gammaproteobacteria bacterium]|nr:hypothetical protein [Gammaproteobacteria bacterium]